MKELTESINMSTGITHPMDEELAKTIILSLHKYEHQLNADVVCAFLLRQLGRESEDANEIKKLITTLNEGRYFRGGEKAGLQNYYESWKEECEE